MVYIMHYIHLAVDGDRVARAAGDILLVDLDDGRV